MLFNSELFERANCTRDEKVKVLEVIDLMRELSEYARSEGILALHTYKVADDMVRRGLRVIVDGVDHNIVRELLVTKVLASRLSGVELLKDMIIIDGMLMIQEGSNPSLMYDKLICYLGTDADLSDMWREGISFDDCM